MPLNNQRNNPHSNLKAILPEELILASLPAY